jgi:hypothetical protein
VLYNASFAKAPYTYRLLTRSEGQGLLTARVGRLVFDARMSLSGFLRGPWVKCILCFDFASFGAIATTVLVR